MSFCANYVYKMCKNNNKKYWYFKKNIFLFKFYSFLIFIDLEIIKHNEKFFCLVSDFCQTHCELTIIQPSSLRI